MSCTTVATTGTAPIITTPITTTTKVLDPSLIKDLPEPITFELCLDEIATLLDQNRQGNVFYSSERLSICGRILENKAHNAVDTTLGTPQQRFQANDKLSLVRDPITTGYNGQILSHKKVNKNGDVILLPREHFYQALCEAHIETGHGGRDATFEYITNHYGGITKEMVAAFVTICPHRRCNPSMAAVYEQLNEVMCASPTTGTNAYSQLPSRPTPTLEEDMNSTVTQGHMDGLFEAESEISITPPMPRSPTPNFNTATITNATPNYYISDCELEQQSPADVIASMPKVTDEQMDSHHQKELLVDVPPVEQIGGLEAVAATIRDVHGEEAGIVDGGGDFSFMADLENWFEEESRGGVLGFL